MSEKSVQKRNHQNMQAVLWGLGILYLGTIVLIYLLTYYNGFLDYYVFHKAFSTNVYVEDIKSLPLETLRHILWYQSFVGVGWTITLIFNAMLFGFSGWITMRKAANKVWYFALIPSLIVLFFVILADHTDLGKFLSLPMASSYIMDFIRPYFIVVALLMALIGGLSERHVILKYKK